MPLPGTGLRVTRIHDLDSLLEIQYPLALVMLAQIRSEALPDD
jgi:hypothetical protein